MHADYCSGCPVTGNNLTTGEHDKHEKNAKITLHEYPLKVVEVLWSSGALTAS